ncbi:tryptophan--tRNA ligase [Candidatus Uhrbacteria bacterium]|nr:tryptophan--tRNA ligase [Candidatus Uhrbacteria bacterium]
MRALTGIQPTNVMHIGNLFGALKPAVELQKETDLVMMIVDLHAITVPQDPKALNDNILFLTAAYLAAGIDPKKTLLFQQSAVPQHAELAWILQTICRMGEAERMTQYKDKALGKGEKVSVGLFTYPILMAADILLYDTEVVPVGEDQKQHVELARDLAERFNRDFGETFVVPRPQIRAAGARIKSLLEPEKKMSKSAANAKSYISLLDDADVIRKKIMSAVTDSDPHITVDDARPGLKNLLTISHLVTGEPMVDIAARYADKGAKYLKEDLAEALVLYLTPLQAEIQGYLANPLALIDMLRAGDERARNIAETKMRLVKQRMGMLLK